MRTRKHVEKFSSGPSAHDYAEYPPEQLSFSSLHPNMALQSGFLTIFVHILAPGGQNMTLREKNNEYIDLPGCEKLFFILLLLFLSGQKSEFFSIFLHVLAILKVLLTEKEKSE